MRAPTRSSGWSSRGTSSSATRSERARRLVGLGLGLCLAGRAHAAGLHEASPQVTPLALPAHLRVLVFSPHPDDETIAVGGLIHRLVGLHAPVRVVFFTNGDGYPEAVQEDFHLQKPADTDYLALGELRQREALCAARRLGLAKPVVSFLGFPDGGLAELWRAHWSRAHPYTSPYTKEDSPPYPGAVNPDVDYDGQDLTSVVARILREFQPDVIVLPHPYDSHLDHAHAAYFVIEAVDALQARHMLPPRVTMLTFLVHNPLWPSAPGTTPDRLPPPPPSKLPDTTWVETKLTPGELAAKADALACYRSQLEVMNGFLHRFLRRNELFGRVQPNVLAGIASIH